MNVLRWLTLALLGAVMLAGAARAEESGMRASKPEVRREIVAVIDAQLEAFRTSNLRRAYSYSAAALQQQTPFRAFANIVRGNYPEIWENTHAEYGLVRDDGDTATLIVHVYSKTGDASYDYTLLHEKAGWRIGSVLRHASKKADAV